MAAFHRIHSAALDELHFRKEALGDGLVFGKAPHPGELLSPGLKGLSQGHQGKEAGGFEVIDGLEEFRIVSEDEVADAVSAADVQVLDAQRASVFRTEEVRGLGESIKTITGYEMPRIA